MFVVGLTGGIGAGKSSVEQQFAKLGVPIIDTDKIARELTKPDRPAMIAILDHFKTPLLKEDGTLDRAKLRSIIFSDPQEKRWLEHLLHPLIRIEVEHELKSLTAPYCIVVIPLLFETEPYAFLDRYLVVDVDVALQIKRVQSRDQVSDVHVQSIIDAQVSREHRLAKAHDVILNDGVLADLVPQVETLHKKYLDLSKQKSERS